MIITLKNITVFHPPEILQAISTIILPWTFYSPGN
jgi:hypothetical protein